MRGVEELHVEGRQFDDIVGGDGAQVGLAQQLLLAQFYLEQPLGQRRGVDGGAQPLLDKVRERADMILVAVRQDHAAHPLQPVDHVAGVGDDDVDAVHFAGGEHQPCIDDQQVVAGLQHQHVFTNFAQATQWDDAQQGRGLSFCLFCHVSISP